MATEERKYTKPEHIQFVKDMDAADRTVEHCDSYLFSEGPCIVCSRWELQDVCKETDVKLRWGSLSWDYTVYPAEVK